jgi:hypothetical protein
MAIIQSKIGLAAKEEINKGQGEVLHRILAKSQSKKI